MDNKCLAPHRLHKPSCLEHSHICLLHLSKLSTLIVICQIVIQYTTGYKQRAENKIHKNVGGKIKDGTGRANPDHKAADTGCIPFAWFGDKFLVHIIPRNSGTGQVVDKVEENQMHTHHWQKRKQS